MVHVLAICLKLYSKNCRGQDYSLQILYRYKFFFFINFKYLFKLIGLFAKNFCSNAVCNIHAVDCSMSYFCLSKKQWILNEEGCLFLSLPRPSVWPGVGDWSESIHKDSCTLHSLLSRTVSMSHPDKKTSKHHQMFTLIHLWDTELL